MLMNAGGKDIHFSDMRILYFGLSGILSRVPLTLLLNGGVNVCGLVLPASILPPYVLWDNGRLPIIPQRSQADSIPLTPSPSIWQLAAQHRLPVYPIHQLQAPELANLFTAVAPDLICVSCFNQIFPPTLLQIPKFGCLNLHPSLLPRFRGPAPLFWTFREGENETGVTIHFMDEGLDSGDIALQARLTFPDGISGAQAEQMCAERGGRLLLQAIRKIAEGDLPRWPQPAEATYQPLPREADFGLNVNWTARRAFNFMRGTQEYERPYPIKVAGEDVWLQTAVSFNLDQTQPEPIRYQTDNAVSLQFNPGVLIAKAA